MSGDVKPCVAPGPSFRRRVAAALVHLYTACGGVLAFFALVAIADGRYERALALLGIAFVVDGTDGYLARRVRVREALPTIDGVTLDLVVDFVTYAIAPLFLLWRAALLPDPPWLWATLIALAAQYDFANTHPLKERGLYTGLPAIWNLYAFHAFYLRPSAGTQMACIGVLVLLTFLPVHFICLSRQQNLRITGIAAVSIYTIACVAVALGLVSQPRRWAFAALAYPAWYLGSSLWVGYRFKLRQRGRLPQPFLIKENSR